MLPPGPARRAKEIAKEAMLGGAVYFALAGLSLAELLLDHYPNECAEAIDHPLAAEELWTRWSVPDDCVTRHPPHSAL